MTDNHRTFLGLDIGTSSLGWALVRRFASDGEIIAAGVRVFPEGMDRTRGEKSLNQDRRLARQLRRQSYRRQRRHLKLRHALTKAQLLPKSDTEFESLCSSTNPYQLRAKGVDSPLSPHELGRAIYHLGQRRGYLSNRKTGSEKDGAVAEGIGFLRDRMNATNSRTLGEYLHKHDEERARRRGHYTHRSMFDDEFEQIWNSQKRFNGEFLTASAKKAIHSAIFHQRPLKIQKHLIGYCEFEPDRRRAYAATLIAQEFRLWQNINHIRILFQDGTSRPLQDSERQQLFEFVELKQTCSWEKIKKELGLFEGDRINLERVRKSGMMGNQTAAIVASALSKNVWQKLSTRQREELVFDLINIEDDSQLMNRLTQYWQFDTENAAKLADKSLGFPKGVMHLSHKALRNITPHLSKTDTADNTGLTYDKACEAAGYNFKKDADALALGQLPMPPNLRNPMVQRALYQVRRVVNAIIKKYGMPDVVRVEMARDLKNTAKERSRIEKNTKDNEALNAEAEKFLKEEMGFSFPSRNDKLKYRLWKECGKICPFTGKSINCHELFVEPQFEVEHIIPYSRCLDDGYLNKTLCHSSANQEKGNRTPSEAFSGERYAEILQRAKSLPGKKFERFALDASERFTSTDFISQQLNETRYIATETRDYLNQLGCQVEPIKTGRFTSQLRHAWGLNNLLSDSGQKTRLDHRHHAVDAIVIALTGMREVQQITRFLNSEKAQQLGLVDIREYPAPFEALREKSQAVIDNIVVSHKTNRKVSGPLHNEFLYSLQTNKETGAAISVIRKPLSALKEKDLDNIHDVRIRELAKAHLKRSGSLKAAFSDPNNPLTIPPKKSDGKPQIVKKVRLAFSRSVRPIGRTLKGTKEKRRNVWTRGNHHIEIIEVNHAKGKKWVGVVVPLIEAVARLGKHSTVPVIQTDHGENTEFIMALHKLDMVKLTYRGERMICRLQEMSQEGEICFREHSDADTKNKTKRIRFRASSFQRSNPELLEVDVLGNYKAVARETNH